MYMLMKLFSAQIVNTASDTKNVVATCMGSDLFKEQVPAKKFKKFCSMLINITLPVKLCHNGRPPAPLPTQVTKKTKTNQGDKRLW